MKLKVICGAQFGTQLWGVGEDGYVYSTSQGPFYRVGDPIKWSKWPDKPDAPQNIVALTAARTRRPIFSVWALDKNGVLHCKSQDYDRNWGDWSPRR